MQDHDEYTIARHAAFNCALIYSITNSDLRNPRSKF